MFRVEGASGEVRVLHAFGPEAQGAEQAWLLLSGDTLSGTTPRGPWRMRTDGTRFRQAPDERHASFPGLGELAGVGYGSIPDTISSNGGIYRMARGTKRGWLGDLPSGSGQAGGPLEGVAGTLYGTTWEGGSCDVADFGVGVGSVWRMSVDTGDAVTLKQFCAYGPDGAEPNFGVRLGPDGWLYGTATKGGALQGGTLFRLRERP